MDWHSVASEEDVARLDGLFGGFHDACLREIHVWTDHYVTNELKMNVVGGLDTSVRLLFQRQVRNPAAIELQFHELTRLGLTPTGENYDSIILGAQLSVIGQGHFMLHIDMRAPSSINDLKSELVVAGRKLAWREVEWMGSELRYGSVD